MSEAGSEEPGIERAVVRWESAASTIAMGESTSFTEFLHHADTRTVIEQLMAIASSDEREMYTSRVARADGVFRSHTEPTRICVWGEDRGAKYGWNAARQWWYFRRPRSVPVDDWPVE